MAEDLVADVFLIAWRRLDEAPDSDELSWLLAISRGVLANLRRADARRRALRDRIGRDLPRAPVVAGGMFEGVEPRVARALGALSQRDQELLLLIAWDELERDQAAKVLGVSRGAFAVRLHRARRRFARALAVEDADQDNAEERAALTEVACDEG